MGDSWGKKELESSQCHMFHFCEQTLNGVTPLKCMTSKIRGGAEKLIPSVLIFNRSINVTSTTFPLFLCLTLMDVSRCQTAKRLQRQRLGGWGFLCGLPHFCFQHFHSLNYFYLWALFSALVLV